VKNVAARVFMQTCGAASALHAAPRFAAARRASSCVQPITNVPTSRRAFRSVPIVRVSDRTRSGRARECSDLRWGPPHLHPKIRIAFALQQVDAAESAITRSRALRRVALEAVVHTFYQSSAGSAAVALLELYEARLTDDELDGLEVQIARARKRRGAR
jgi:hypothetical protein